MNETLKYLIIIPCAILLVIGVICLQGVFVYYLWGWIAWNFNLPTMPYKVAVCVALIIRMLKPKVITSSRD